MPHKEGEAPPLALDDAGLKRIRDVTDEARVNVLPVRLQIRIHARKRTTHVSPINQKASMRDSQADPVPQTVEQRFLLLEHQ